MMADMQLFIFPLVWLWMSLKHGSCPAQIIFAKHAFASSSNSQGYSPPELCMVLAIFGIATSLAAPTVSQWLWRAKIENAIRSWSADLQSARLQALRTGQAMQLQRTTQCSSTNLPNGDWRCGWEIVSAPGYQQPALLTNALNGELIVTLSPSQNALMINANGEPVAGGLRLMVKPRVNNSAIVISACINTAGRLRLVNSATCS